MSEESKQGAPGGASVVCHICGREKNTRSYAVEGFICGTEEVCYSIGYDRERRRAESAEKEVRDRDATHVMCNKVLREEVPALRSRLSTAEKERDDWKRSANRAAEEMANWRAMAEQTLASRDQMGAALREVRGLVYPNPDKAERIIDEAISGSNTTDAPTAPKASEIASDSSALEKALGALRAAMEMLELEDYHVEDSWLLLKEAERALSGGAHVDAPKAPKTPSDPDLR